VPRRRKEKRREEGEFKGILAAIFGKISGRRHGICPPIGHTHSHFTFHSAHPPIALLQTAAAIFAGGLDLLSVKSVMRKLSRGVVRRGRTSSTPKMSVMGAAAGLKAGGKAKAKGE